MNGNELSLVDLSFVPIFAALNMLKPILPCDMLKDCKRVLINLYSSYNNMEKI